MPDAAALLAGTRGRRLCLELLAPPFAGPYWPRFPTHEDLQQAVRRTDVDRLAGLQEPAALLPALQACVDAARYWQEADEDDQRLADPAVASVLQPVAEAVLSSPAATWWTDPVHLTAQQQMTWPRAHVPVTSAPTALAAWLVDAEADEYQARRERPADPRANWSGRWWSTPAMAGLPTTTGCIDVAGRATPVGLLLVEDSFGDTEAQVQPLAVLPGARTYEIAGPQNWVDLVSAYPRVVTSSKRHDWWRVTGWEGAWHLPDWTAVARDWDGVRVSLLGYLTTAGQLLDTGPACTLLAGWNPDATYWLADVLDLTGEATTWRAQSDLPLGWSPQ